MEEQAPPLPEEESVGASSSGGAVMDVTLKRKTVHTNVTVVESATRFWLSAQVMVACIMLGLLALSIQSSRESITYFPATFNSSCTGATYEVKRSIEGALIVMLDEAVNITNTQYQRSVNLTRSIVSKSMNMSMDLFVMLLKNINPVVYCAIDSGLSLVQPTRNTLLDLENNIPNLSCPAPINEICDRATEALRTILGGMSGVLRSWPEVPPSITDLLDESLRSFSVDKYVRDLANFPAPDIVLVVNSTEIIQNAMRGATAFDDIAVTCTDVSVKFESATSRTSRIMYYIEIAIWASIAALLIGIFIVAIVKQFPTVVVEWFTRKMEYYTNMWEARLEGFERNTVRTWQLYLIWTLKYINFKKAFLTTSYGIIGIILIYNLTNITNGASAPVEVWVETSLGPGLDRVQAKLQDGINQVIDTVEIELNIILQDQILSAIVPANGTLNEIVEQKEKIQNAYNNISRGVYDIPVVGPGLANGLNCMLPLGALQIVDTGIDLMVSFIQEIMGAHLDFPRLSFPNMTAVAVSATHLVVTRSVEVIQSELKEYQIIFIILSVAFGILVLQGLLFVALRRIAMRIKKQRRLSRMKSQRASQSSISVQSEISM